MSRHPYERHPEFPVCTIVGGAVVFSGAKLTRTDGIDFLRLAPEIGITTKTRSYRLEQANYALADLRAGRFQGADVLIPQADATSYEHQCSAKRLRVYPRLA
jgi:D-arabinose 1-dehydrogenase-like Zn-dependent alcohol dehydrogenase